MGGAVDPVGEMARIELDRLTHRWHTLPVGQARQASDAVRALASTWLGGPVPVPDLGPATALDQLTVAVYEAARAGTPDADLAHGLADLRRTISATVADRSSPGV